MEVPKDCFRLGAPRSVPKECPKDCFRLGARVLLQRILGRKIVITITGRALGESHGARSWGAAWGAFSGLGRGMGRALGARHGARSWGATWGGLLGLSGTLQTVSKTRPSPE